MALEYETNAAAFPPARASSPAPPLVVRLDEARRVDLDALESSASHQGVKAWLRARLMRQDRYLPIDEDNLEPPAEVFADLWLRAALSSGVHACLNTACAELLIEARQSAPEDWHAELLGLVARIAPPACRRILDGVAGQTEFAPQLVETDLDILWLQAAAAYEPVSPDLIAAWRGRFGSERYDVLAFNALANNLELGVISLVPYYRAIDDEGARELALHEAIRVLLDHGPGLCLDRLRRHRERLEKVLGLCGQIDRVLGELGHPPAFRATPEPRPGPICARTIPPPSKYHNIAVVRPAA